MRVARGAAGAGRAARSLLILPLLVATGCGGKGNTVTGPTPPLVSSTNPRVSAIGDSITAGFRSGVVPYPARLDSILKRKNPQAQVFNRGVGGERTSAALQILEQALASDRPGFVIFMLGTNDMRSAVPPQQAAENLRAAVRRAKAADTIPVLATIPRQIGPAIIFFDGVVALNALIRQVAAQENVTLAEVFEALPDETFFTEDGFHPNALGDTTLAVLFDAALTRAGYPATMLARRAR